MNFNFGKRGFPQSQKMQVTINRCFGALRSREPFHRERSPHTLCSALVIGVLLIISNFLLTTFSPNDLSHLSLLVSSKP
jgi:hypothetical protein